MINPYILLIVIFLLSFTSIICMKLASMQVKGSIKNYLFMFFGLGSYGLSFITYSFVLKSLSLALAVPLISITNLLFSVAMGVLFFKEEFRKIDVLGLFLGITAIVILVYK